MLANCGLTIIDVMDTLITRCVQPLQQNTHLVWCYSGTSDSTRSRRLGWEDLAAILADLFKVEKEGFNRPFTKEGYSAHNPIEYVSVLMFVISGLHPLYCLIYNF